jgi:Flp pilus assembly protein TadD
LLESNPPGAAVTMSGRRIGETPLIHEGLHAGSHTVTVTRPGYLPLTLRVTIQDDLTTRQRLTLTPERRTPTGELLVSSMPSGADVYLEGRWIGRTPLHTSVSAGQHRLSLRQEGYESVTRTVKVVSDLTSAQRISLVAIAPEPPPPLAARPVPTPEPAPSPTPSPTPSPLSVASTPVPAPPAVRAPRDRVVSTPHLRPEPEPAKPPATRPPITEPRARRASGGSSPSMSNLPAVQLPELQVPQLDWTTLGERIRHAGFSLMMLGFVATLGHALWRQRPRSLPWQPDAPSSGFHPLPPWPGDTGYLAARATDSAIRRAERGDFAQALADLSEAFRLIPCAETAYNLALGWEFTDMSGWAEVAYRTALQFDAEHRDAGLNLANLLVAHEQALPALVLYRQLSERLPDDGAIAFNFGNLLASLGQLDHAQAQFKRARRLLPGDPGPRVNLGIVRRRKRALFWARALRRGPRAR